MKLWAVLALTAAAHGQVPITVVNSATSERKSWVTCVAPASKLPDTEKAVVKPQGWPVVLGARTGARGRYVHVLATIGAQERVEGTIVASYGVAADSEAAKPKAPEKKAAPTAKEPKESEKSGDKATPWNPVPIVRVNGNAWRPTNLRVVEKSAAGIVVHAVGRIPKTMLVANAWFRVYPGHRSIPFELLLTNSDSSTNETRQDIEQVELQTAPECFPAVDWLLPRGGAMPRGTKTGGFVKLLGKTWLGFGQSLGYRGRLVFLNGAAVEERPTLLAEIDSPLHAVCPDWSDAWGPWGAMPVMHPIELGVRGAFGHHAARQLETKILRFAQAHLGGNVDNLWAKNSLCLWGTNDRPADTGDQADFGTTSMLETLGPKGGNPTALWLMWPSILREAARPTCFYESDGTPLDLKKHPEWRTWGLWHHYHPGDSPDRLGKAKEGNWPTNTVRVKDFAHASSNFLAGHGVLTGSYLVKHLCRHEMTAARAYALTVGLGQTRAWGRVSLLVAWNYLATGDKAALQHFAERVSNDLQLTGNVLKAGKAGWQVVTRPNWDKPLKIFYWMPWHDGLAIQGLDALSRVVSSPKLDELLGHWCRGWIRTAWWNSGGRWRIGSWLRYHEGEQEGQPLSAARLASLPDKMWGNDDRGTAFVQWAHPAVRVCLRRLADDEEGRSRAKAIDDWLVGLWRAGVPNGFDRHSTWFSSVR